MRQLQIKYLIFFISLLASVTSLSQIIKVSGEAKVRQERNMTEIETRNQAEQQAIIAAIENAFGTYAEQQTNLTIVDGKTSYNIIGTTKVKGDWIETISIEFTEDIRKSETDEGVGTLKYITCKIKGKARKSTPKAQIEFDILNNYDIRSRTTDFIHEEQLFVHFKSPVNGYLSIFLDDNNFVYRLLPYTKMDDEFQNHIPIDSDMDYTFFSIRDNLFKNYEVDEQILFTINNEIEYNSIYIIFSEDEFLKPVLTESMTQDGRLLPKRLSIPKFRQWLLENRSISDNFQDIKVKISIRPED